MKIVIPGGSGQVGHILARDFHARGHEVVVLSRSPRHEWWRVVEWNGLTPGAWVSGLDGSDACINLAGRSVNCRYTKQNRREIYESRIQSTLLLNQVIASLARPPRLWINASTATISRHAHDRPMDEMTGELGGNEPGAPDNWNFSIEVKGWEQAFFSMKTPRTRKVVIRSAIIVSLDKGGAFDLLLNLVRHGLGGAQGSGTKFVSWIHDLDFSRAIDLLIAHADLSGIVNLASPNPVPNRDFMCSMRDAWGIRFGLPMLRHLIEVGAFFLRTESELILKSRRVVPTRLHTAGFQFVFPNWPDAARDLVARWREHDRCH